MPWSVRIAEPAAIAALAARHGLGANSLSPSAAPRRGCRQQPCGIALGQSRQSGLNRENGSPSASRRCGLDLRGQPELPGASDPKMLGASGAQKIRDKTGRLTLNYNRKCATSGINDAGGESVKELLETALLYSSQSTRYTQSRASAYPVAILSSTKVARSCRRRADTQALFVRHLSSVTVGVVYAR